MGMQERSFTLYNCKVIDAEQPRKQRWSTEFRVHRQRSRNHYKLQPGDGSSLLQQLNRPTRSWFSGLMRNKGECSVLPVRSHLQTLLHCCEESCSPGLRGMLEGWIFTSGRSPKAGNGYPLQYSCLENSMDREAWWATVHGVAKSQTWLSDWTTPTVSLHIKALCASSQWILTNNPVK